MIPGKRNERPIAHVGGRFSASGQQSTDKLAVTQLNASLILTINQTQVYASLSNSSQRSHTDLNCTADDDDDMPLFVNDSYFNLWSGGCWQPSVYTQQMRSSRASVR